MSGKKAVPVMMLVGFLLLAGCRKTPAPLLSENLPPNHYLIYYLNTSTTGFVPYEYEAEAKELSGLVNELYHGLENVPADLDAKSPLPARVEMQSIQWDQNVLYLHFDSNYALMEPGQEILCRAALVKTMSQLQGVEFISIYSGEQPLMDRSQNPVGMLSVNDFVDSISDVNTYEKSELSLFFADETGTFLVEEKREVVHSINTSMERLIVEQLMEGPETPGSKRAIASDAKLLNVSVNDNVCYLNFDSAFLNTLSGVEGEIAIYSIVNSLTQMPTVNRVQFSVNGAPGSVFRENISLDQLFEENMNYVSGGELQ